MLQEKYYEENKYTHVIIGGIMFVITMSVWIYEEISTFRFLKKVYQSKNS